MVLQRAFIVFLITCLQVSTIPARTPYVLSERVGSDIDLAERHYFGLFTKFRAFHSARLFLNDAIHVEINIRQARLSVFRDTVIVVPLKDVLRVQRYIDRFELLFDLHRRPYVPPLISSRRVPSTISNSSECICVITTDGNLCQAWPVYANRNALVISDRTYFDWKSCCDEIRVLSADNIKSVSIERDGWAMKGFIAGASIGAISYLCVPIYWRIGRFGVLVYTALFYSIGLALGALPGIDTHTEIAGSIRRFRAMSQRELGTPVFPSIPPPEIEKLLRDHESRSSSQQQRTIPTFHFGGMMSRVSLANGAITPAVRVFEVRFQDNPQH
jgi:hypothetical protein